MARRVRAGAAKRNVLRALKQGFLLGDGGNVEEARTRGYGVPRAILEFPHVVRLIHQDYFRAGAQVLRAMTGWGAHPAQRGRWGDRAEEIHRTAVRLAQEVAGGEAFVAGCVGPTGIFRAGDAGARDRARAEWEGQAAALAEVGVDLLICEPFGRLDEARLALGCCKKTRLPTMVALSFRLNEDVTEDGASPAACARALVDEGADAVGTSGALEPQDMWPAAVEMRGAVDAPVAFIPCGYRTSVSGWESVREAMVIYGVEMAKFALQAKMHGINFFGGGDGAGTEIIRSVAQALGCERAHVGLRPRWVGDREGVIVRSGN
jgi:methionine synthase I (cobalamin-dependent)